MRVRMKRKHLLFAGASFLTVFLVFIFVLLPILEERSVDKLVAERKAHAGDKVLELIDNTTSVSRKLELIEKYVIQFGRVENQIYISAGISMWSMNEDYWSGFSLGEKAPYLHYYLENQMNKNRYSYEEATLAYADYLEKNEGREQALIFLEEKEREIAKSRDYPAEQVLLKRAMLLVEKGENEKAKQVLLDYQEQEQQRITALIEAYDHYIPFYQSEGWTRLMAEILIKENNVEEAIAVIDEWEESVAEHVEQFEEDGQVTASDRPLSLLKERITKLEQQEGGPFGSIKGTIKREDGKALEGVYVFLRDPGNVHMSGHPNYDYYVTTTNKDGFYEFKDVLPDSYQIALGFDFEHVDGYIWPAAREDWLHLPFDKEITYDITLMKLMTVQTPVNNEKLTGETITFQWEPVKNAAYYRVQVNFPVKNGTQSYYLRSYVEEEQLVVPVEELMHLGFASAYRMDDDGNFFVEPAGLLGFAASDKRYSWSVTAFDESNREITRSNGYRLNENTVGDIPFFEMPTRQLTEADSLVLAEKYDEALTLYREDIAANRFDWHALKMAARLIHFELINQKVVDAALEKEMYGYMETLAFELKIASYVEQLLNRASEKEDWEEYQKWFNEYEEIGERINYFQAYDHSQALAKQERWAEVVKWLHYSVNEDPANEFISHLLAAELVVGTDKELVKTLAAQYPLLINEYDDWSDVVANVEGNEQLQEALTSYLKGDKERFTSKSEKVKHPGNQAFLSKLREHRYY